ncbi:MAG: OB-fold domain-containing protein [Sphingobium sp.]
MDATLAPRETPAPPQPAPSLDSAPYWESLKQGVLAMQRCAQCRHWQFPPAEICRKCAGTVALEPISGRGTIYTYIIEHRGGAPGFEALLPYPIALVTPEEAPHIRIPARIVDARPDELAIGHAVTAQIIPLPGGDFSIPVFRLA